MYRMMLLLFTWCFCYFVIITIYFRSLSCFKTNSFINHNYFNLCLLNIQFPRLFLSLLSDK